MNYEPVYRTAPATPGLLIISDAMSSKIWTKKIKDCKQMLDEEELTSVLNACIRQE